MSANTHSIFEKNIVSLERLQPELAASIAHATPTHAPVFSEKTRSGALTHGVFVNTHDAPNREQQKKYFHSRIDPIHEAKRIAAHFSSTNSLIYIGLGSAKHIEQLLANKRLQQLIIAEPSTSLCAALFRAESYSTVLQDDRLVILSPLSSSTSEAYTIFLHELTQYLQSELIPLFTPNISVHSLHNRKYFQGDIIDTLKLLCKETLQQKLSDHAVMQHFGQQWQRNIVWNASRHPVVTAHQKLGALQNKAAILLGAGPGLEDFLQKNTVDKKGHCILATDSVVPICMKARQGIDIVCSIDAQVYSYLHGNAGYPLDPLYISALSSYTPQALKKPAFQHVSIAGPHPFEQFLLKQKNTLLTVPLYGTNVASFALLILKLLGAKNVQSYGCDFLYPRGKRYCRETYTYIYDFRSAERLQSTESQSCARLIREGARAYGEGSATYYSTEKFAAYKREFTSLHRTLFEQKTVAQFAPLSQMSKVDFLSSQDFRTALSATQALFADLARTYTLNRKHPATRACLPFAVQIFTRRASGRNKPDREQQEVHAAMVDAAIRTAFQKTNDYIHRALSDI